ncbi:MAG TPA: nucleotidyltransferase domain-containing protein, partial [Paracoccaceae bacterium]|nr:nucleotidyltransferase domain-containing protein [Paracoccaceae bacterium]
MPLRSAPDDLICPAASIFDAPAVAQALAAATAGLEPGQIRAAVVPVLSQALQQGRAAIAEAFSARPFDARPVTRAYCWLTDCIVASAQDVAIRLIHPQKPAGSGERLALIAVGGYGRGEMAPQSDVDLLFLSPTRISPWAESVIETMLYILWDLRLKVGHASRTIKDCLRLGDEDFTIR